MYLAPVINIGTGQDITICELAELLRQVVGYEKEVVFDASKPDGTLRKVLDVSRLTAIGWQAKQDLMEALVKAYQAAW